MKRIALLLSIVISICLPSKAMEKLPQDPFNILAINTLTSLDMTRLARVNTHLSKQVFCAFQNPDVIIAVTQITRDPTVVSFLSQFNPGDIITLLNKTHKPDLLKALTYIGLNSTSYFNSINELYIHPTHLFNYSHFSQAVNCVSIFQPTRLQRLSMLVKKMTEPGSQAAVLVETARMRFDEELGESQLPLSSAYKTLYTISIQEGLTPFTRQKALIYWGCMLTSYPTLKDVVSPLDIFDSLERAKNSPYLNNDALRLSANYQQVQLWDRAPELMDKLTPIQAFNQLKLVYQSDVAPPDIRRNSLTLAAALRYKNMITEDQLSDGETADIFHTNMLATTTSRQEKIQTRFLLSEMRSMNRIGENKVQTSTLYHRYLLNLEETDLEEMNHPENKGLFHDLCLQSAIRMALLECRNLGYKVPQYVNKYTKLLIHFVAQEMEKHPYNTNAILALACLQASQAVECPQIFASPAELFGMLRELSIEKYKEADEVNLNKAQLYKAILRLRGDISDDFLTVSSAKNLLGDVIKSSASDSEDILSAKKWMTPIPAFQFIPQDIFTKIVVLLTHSVSFQDIFHLFRTSRSIHTLTHKALEDPIFINTLTDLSQNTQPDLAKRHRFYFLNAMLAAENSFPPITINAACLELGKMRYLQSVNEQLLSNLAAFNLFTHVSKSEATPTWIWLNRSADLYRAHMRLFEDVTDTELPIADVYPLLESVRTTPEAREEDRLTADFRQIVEWTKADAKPEASVIKSSLTKNVAFERLYKLYLNQYTPDRFLGDIYTFMILYFVNNDVPTSKITAPESFTLVRKLIDHPKVLQVNKSMGLFYMTNLRYENKVDESFLPLKNLYLGFHSAFCHMTRIDLKMGCAIALADLDCRGFMPNDLPIRQAYYDFLRIPLHMPDQFSIDISDQCAFTIARLQTYGLVPAIYKNEVLDEIFRTQLSINDDTRITAKANLAAALYLMNLGTAATEDPTPYLEKVVMNPFADLDEKEMAKKVLTQWREKTIV